ncbi:hypothetical protein HU200_053679 [Digitaria exilis]|uniref:Uncharacterized protein n=1 Tax=Digitaria exilis TaxID=1010633 RepID=A0A835E339_9POAL|nr:hypothetical protein HU200_053679 [Digitaria exilis]
MCTGNTNLMCISS